MSRFQIQKNHAGAPQLCRIVSGRGDAANCREIIATGDELQEILTLITNNEKNDMKAEDVKKGMTLSQVTGIRREAFGELLEQNRKDAAHRDQESRRMIREAIKKEARE